MSNLKCVTCGYEWEGTVNPFCPMCNVKKWETDPDFIRPKHDPSVLPLSMPDPRSVVTMDFIYDKELYIYTLATNGIYFYDSYHHNFSCILNQALGATSGSLVPKGFEWPTKPLDSQIVVDVFGRPHVFALDWKTVVNQESKGRLIRARMCEIVHCTNLAIPGTKRCTRH